MLAEHEHGVRARLVLLDPAAIGPGAQVSDAGGYRPRHAGVVDLVMDDVVMRLLAVGELLEAVRRVEPDLPVVLVSAARWQRIGSDREPATRRRVPFDPDVITAYLHELQSLDDAA